MAENETIPRGYFSRLRAEVPSGLATAGFVGADLVTQMDLLPRSGAALAGGIGIVALVDRWRHRNDGIVAKPAEVPSSKESSSGQGRAFFAGASRHVPQPPQMPEQPVTASEVREIVREAITGNLPVAADTGSFVAASSLGEVPEAITARHDNFWGVSAPVAETNPLTTILGKGESAPVDDGKILLFASKLGDHRDAHGRVSLASLAKDPDFDKNTVRAYAQELVKRDPQFKGGFKDDISDVI